MEDEVALCKMFKVTVCALQESSQSLTLPFPTFLLLCRSFGEEHVRYEVFSCVPVLRVSNTHLLWMLVHFRRLG